MTHRGGMHLSNVGLESRLDFGQWQTNKLKDYCHIYWPLSGPSDPHTLHILCRKKTKSGYGGQKSFFVKNGCVRGVQHSKKWDVPTFTKFGALWKIDLAMADHHPTRRLGNHTNKQGGVTRKGTPDVSRIHLGPSGIASLIRPSATINVCQLHESLPETPLRKCEEGVFTTGSPNTHI